MAVCYARETKAMYTQEYQSDTNPVTPQENPAVVVQGDGVLYRTFLQYDLSGIPYQSVITSAKLRLYCYRHYNADPSAKSNVARVTESWEEAELSWGNEPATGGAYLAEDVTRPEVGTWTSWDITGLVQEWVDRTHPNYGLHIVNVDEGVYDTEWWVYTRRYSSGSYATYIEIEYEPAPEYRITRQRLTEIADQVRRITGVSGTLTPKGMVDALSDITIE